MDLVLDIKKLILILLGVIIAYIKKKKFLEVGLDSYRVPLVAQIVKNPPAMQETRVQSLGWEDTLEKGMATCSSILAWKIPWTEEPGRLQSMGSQRVGQD